MALTNYTSYQQPSGFEEEVDDQEAYQKWLNNMEFSATQEESPETASQPQTEEVQSVPEEGAPTITDPAVETQDISQFQAPPVPPPPPPLPSEPIPDSEFQVETAPADSYADLDIYEAIANSTPYNPYTGEYTGPEETRPQTITPEMVLAGYRPEYGFPTESGQFVTGYGEPFQAPTTTRPDGSTFVPILDPVTNTPVAGHGDPEILGPDYLYQPPSRLMWDPVLGDYVEAPIDERAQAFSGARWSPTEGRWVLPETDGSTGAGTAPPAAGNRPPIEEPRDLGDGTGVPGEGDGTGVPGAEPGDGGDGGVPAPGVDSDFDTYLEEWIRGQMESPSRFDADLVREGQAVIEEGFQRAQDRAYRALEEHFAGRGLTASSLEATEVRRMLTELSEQQRQQLFELGREQAMTHAADIQAAGNLANILGDQRIRNRALDLQEEGMGLDDAYRWAQLEQLGDIESRRLDLEKLGLDADEAYRYAILERDENWRTEDIILDASERGLELVFDEDGNIVGVKEASSGQEPGSDFYSPDDPYWEGDDPPAGNQSVIRQAVRYGWRPEGWQDANGYRWVWSEMSQAERIDLLQRLGFDDSEVDAVMQLG